jgi:hypothetical protein
LNPPRPIVVHRGGADVLMGEQFLCDSDLLGREHAPGGGRRGPHVMRTQTNAEPLLGMPRKYSFQRGIC